MAEAALQNAHAQSAYEPLFQDTYIADEAYEVFNLLMTDDTLNKMLVQSLDADIDYWQKDPWRLRETDEKNVKFLLGDQLDGTQFLRTETKFVDNRLFSATRAILSYATGQLAKPEVVPSRSDESYVKMARAIQEALYQHSLDEKVDQKVRASVFNLLVRKRGYMKLRYDPNAGAYGDVITEVVNPEDITIDRHAGFMENPNKIYHRIRCSVEELCARFPKKEAEIKAAYQIKQGRYTQMSRFVTYFECWFTYMDAKNIPREGVCWFIPEHQMILDKMPNPNWIYTGNDKKDKAENVTYTPPKPFIWFNYLNLGHSFIDETCLFDQAKPQQEMLNKRGRQFNENIDFMNGRWLYSKKAISDDDATKFVNKGAKTLMGVNAEDVGKAVQVLTPTQMTKEVYQSILDFRAEIDTMMGTPSVFRGGQPDSQDTLGRDLMVKQQAGMLQDDLVRAVSLGMAEYYKIKLQMWRVYYTEDYWFQVKGGDGKFDFVMLNGDTVDSNVKIGVQTDSTLPIDKESIRANAMALAKINRIDQLTLLEDLGVPDPEMRTERFIRSTIDPYTYMQSVEAQMDNNDAEVDIMLLTNGNTPQERDNYDEGYLQYFNHYITTNKFSQLEPDVKQRIIAFLIAIQHVATQTANLQGSMLNDAGIINRPPIFPLPKRTENIRLVGNMSPGMTQQIAGSEGQMFTPVTQAQNAQDPQGAGGQQIQQAGPPNSQ